MSDDSQVIISSYDHALTEVKRIVHITQGKEVILPGSKFEDDFQIIAQTLVDLERALQRKEQSTDAG